MLTKAMTEVGKIDHRLPSRAPSTTKCRILYDIPCKVCQDHSSGKHYGIFACDGCAGFFKRSIRRQRQYVCKSKGEGGCLVDKTHRNQCRACRLSKCLQAGMNKDAVQHERGPRNSTLRRQMSLYFRDPSPDSPPPRPRSPTPPEPNHSRTPPSTVTHMPPVTVSAALALPFPLPPQPPPLDLKISFPPRHPAPTGGGSTHLELVRPPPEITALTLDRMHMLTTRATTLLAPTPKYPHELALPVMSADSVCETAARLLFMNVRWTKQLPAYTALPFRDQLLLLEEGWRELFVLSAAQFLLPVEAGPLLASCGLSGETSERLLPILQDIKLFQDILSKFKTMCVDPTEYACLKAIVLFKTVWESGGVEVKALRDLGAVTALQDQAQLTLNKYITSAYPTQPFRFGKLLLLLPSLRAVGSRTIQELFFRRTIGAIPIERIICDMYKTADF
ncbi:nuclear receptor subfamily 2 group E member 1-like [Cherax quadricarinatus]|uniref:nuclear receptor subfamily 2 group E member 1-like n=1 Tax=Cherax quadricarinatus TaxID=27406 RepID=UPI002379863C|nr:nuclear receptor subfamily 2 group E member 1-like [Cherax quadricarinatus]